MTTSTWTRAWSTRLPTIPPGLVWIVQRVLMVIPLLMVVSVVAFSLSAIIPGDPAAVIAGEDASVEQVALIREQLGLNDSLPKRFLSWANKALHGDLGVSLYSPVPVTTLLLQRLPVTLSLAGLAILLAICFGGLLGTLAAVFRGRWADRFVTGFASIGVAVPSFWLGLMLVLALSVERPWFPSMGYESLTVDPARWLWHLLLPAVSLAAAPTAEIARQLRAALVNVLEQDYVRTARANGLSSRSVIFKHAMKNAAMSVITIIGIQVSFLLGGAVVVEQIFGLPGIGNLVIYAVLQRDLPVVQGVVLMAAVFVLVVNLITDAMYGFLNPRVRT